MHSGHATEGVLGVREGGIEEELAHHLGIVVHGLAGHAECN